MSAVPLLVAVVLFATLLRVWALDRPPLSWDEGNNAYFAHQNVAQVLEVSRATHDTDPPAHRLALALWLGLLGDSAYTLRLLSSALGISTVLLVYHWARWLAGPREALLAAALTTLSPMLVCYSREAKAYPFVTFFGLSALYLWFRYLDFQERPRPLLWVLYVLAEALAVGAHYYAVFLVVAQGVWLTIDVARDHARRDRARLRVLRWLGAQVAVAALLLPWVVLTLGSALEGARAASELGALAFPAYLRDVFVTLAIGLRAPAWAAIAALLVLGTGMLAGLVRGGRRGVGLLACAVFVPVLCGYVTQSRLSFFSARFLLYTAPLLCLVAALGLSRLRHAGLVLCAGLAVAWLAAVPGAFAPGVGPEEDIRPLAQTLQAHARPADGVIVGYIWQEGILRMLAPRVPVSYHLGWYTPEKVDRQMRELLAEHPRLWLVAYRAPLQHPQNTAGWWLEQHAARGVVTESGHGRIVLYIGPPVQVPSETTTVAFEDGITLAHTALSNEVVVGQFLLVPLHWSANAPVSHSYSVFVHCYDRAGNLWTQGDGVPVNGLKPFPHFAAHETVTDCHTLWLAPETPPGQYVLAVGLYDPATGRRLKLVSGAEAGKDRHIIGEVRVVADGR